MRPMIEFEMQLEVQRTEVTKLSPYERKIKSMAQRVSHCGSQRVSDEIQLSTAGIEKRAQYSVEALRRFYGDSPALISGYEAGYKLINSKGKGRVSEIWEEAKFAVKANSLVKAPINDLFAFPIAAIIGAGSAGSKDPVSEILVPYTDYCGLKTDLYTMLLARRFNIFRSVENVLLKVSGQGVVLGGVGPDKQRFGIVARLHDFELDHRPR